MIMWIKILFLMFWGVGKVKIINWSYLNFYVMVVIVEILFKGVCYKYFVCVL